MTLAVWYWILLAFWLIHGVWVIATPGQPFTLRVWGGNFLTFILFVILGFGVFGSPIK